MTNQADGDGPGKTPEQRSDTTEQSLDGEGSRQPALVVLGEKSCFTEELVCSVWAILSRKLNKAVDVPAPPIEFTKERFVAWQKFNLIPRYLPGKDVMESHALLNLPTPHVPSMRLIPGWCLVDFTPSVEYTDGTQVFPNDPFAPIIECLRREGRIGKFDETPLGSRFAISNYE